MSRKTSFLCFVSLIIFRVAFICGDPTMKAVLYKTGGVDNLSIGTVPKPKAEKTRVLIRVQYTALNRADTLQRRGLYNPPPGDSDILGIEVSGVIEEVGEECVRQWK